MDQEFIDERIRAAINDEEFVENMIKKNSRKVFWEGVLTVIVIVGTAAFINYSFSGKKAST